MIKFLDLDKFTKGLKPVTATEWLTRTGEFSPDGLFSENIFGNLNSVERNNTFSYINLYSEVIQPHALKILLQLDRKIDKFISTESNFILDKEGRLIEDESGISGMTEFIKLFPKIKFRTDTDQREKLVKLIDFSYKQKTLFIDKLVIVPPEQRPAYQDDDGNWVIDELNNVYLSVMRKTLNVKSAKGSGALFDILLYGLQIAINNHHSFLEAKIGKKHGMIRSELLSKRVDYSGRAVIVPGPKLKINELGLPIRLAVSLFQDFIIYQLLNAGRISKDVLSKEIKDFNDLDLSVDSIKKVLKAIKNADEIPKSLYDIFFEATEVAMMGRVILSKRDPSLHAESVRAYNPILIDGSVIQLCTMQVGGHNADFDGDAMAVFHPLTKESQEEARKNMMRAGSGTSSTEITFELSKEMCVGLYTMTKDVPLKKSPIAVSVEDLKNANDPYIAVKFRGKNTTMGKAIFNDCLPNKYPFVSQQVDKKLANKIISELVDSYGDEVGEDSCYKMKEAGFKFSTIMAPSITLDQLQLPPKVYELKKKLKGASIEDAGILLKQMIDITKKHLEGTGIQQLAESGSTKGWDQPMQILVAKGVVSDPEARLFVVSGGFADGLKPKEYFTASSGARKGIIDRVLNTATTGYTSRKLAFVLNNLTFDPNIRDCKTTRTTSIKLTSDLIRRLHGRYIMLNGKAIELDPKTAKPGTIVELRTPIYCQSKNLCLTCYGNLIKRIRSPYVGVAAAQIIGERGTQLIMRTFHTGGSVTVLERDILKDIAENDSLANLES